jgi:hypothetical protein
VGELLGDERDLGDRFDSLCGAYRDFSESYRTVAGRLTAWPPEFGVLFADVDYLEPLDVPVDGVPRGLSGDLAFHLRDRWQWWQNTNLRKYLRLALEAGVQ